MLPEDFSFLFDIQKAVVEDPNLVDPEEFAKYSHMYWSLNRTLPQKDWQTVNDCFCYFMKVHLLMQAVAEYVDKLQTDG